MFLCVITVKRRGRKNEKCVLKLECQIERGEKENESSIETDPVLVGVVTKDPFRVALWQIDTRHTTALGHES